MLDNLSNFTVHFGAAFLALAALFAWRRGFAWAAAAAAAAGVALAPAVPYYFGRDPAPGPGTAPAVSLFVSNVYYHNTHKRQLLERITAESPDVVGLVEVNSAWLRRLKVLRERYPYRYELPDESFVGLALYSRFPLEKARILAIDGNADAPAIAATLVLPGKDVELVLAHPPSPESADRIAARNRQIRALAQYAAGVQGPLVMAGDFNLAMWNTGYRPLREVAGLHNARRGHGVGPTWPAPWPIGVPIDQILGNAQVRFGKFRVLGAVGSDHLPITAEFTVR